MQIIFEGRWRDAVVLILVGWMLGLSVAGWYFWQRLTTSSGGLIPVSQTDNDQVKNVSTPKSTPQTIDVSTASATLEKLQAEVTNLKAAIATIAASSTTTTIRSNTSTTNVISASYPTREYVVPMGGGTTTNRDWTELPSAQVIFDPKNYQPVKALYVEVAGSIVSGEVEVMITDMTHNRPYYEATLIFNSGTAAWKRSQALAVPPGASTLQLSMRTSNGELATVHESRIVVVSGR